MSVCDKQGSLPLTAIKSPISVCNVWLRYFYQTRKTVCNKFHRTATLAPFLKTHF